MLQWLSFSQIQSLWPIIWNFHQLCSAGQGLAEVGIETEPQPREGKMNIQLEMLWRSSKPSPDHLVDVCVT